jgi:hypothetical protein
MADANFIDQKRIGALDCIQALKKLEHSAENLPSSADAAGIYFSIQKYDAKAVSDAFGPMTPRQEGAFRAMAEYIHASITSGTPNLDLWKPLVALTAQEFDAQIERYGSNLAETQQIG